MVKIDNTYDMKMMHLFKGSSSKYLMSEKSLQKLKNAVKENVKAPDKDIKVYLIKFKYDEDNDVPLRISVAPYFITDKLALIQDHDNVAITIKYSTDELKKYNFKKEHIDKIIKAIKKDLVSYEGLADNISNILN